MAQSGKISINDWIFSGRFWYDVDKDKFYSQNLDGKLKRFIVDTINELIYDNEFTEILSEFDDI